jgi:GT2 family glycosyltransferase
MTGVCVTYNTAELFKIAFESFRRFHPNIDFVIVDNSDRRDPCWDYVESLKSCAKIIHTEQNIGHGRGLDLGIRQSDDDIVVIFDSDIVMLRSPLSEMISLMNDDVYGVGWLTTIGHDGFDFGTPGRGHVVPITYLHPYFAMINVRQYKRFTPFVHHGAPWFKTAVQLYESGLSGKLLRSCDSLTGHSRGAGINWTGRIPTHIRHDFGGTRAMNKKNGKKEIDGKWDR